MNKIFEGTSPKTQSVEAVKSLLSCVGRAVDPIPSFLELGSVRLTLSSKKDVFYTTTAQDCSCPARTYHPQQPCKHMRAMDIETQVPESWINTAGFRPIAEEGI